MSRIKNLFHMIFTENTTLRQRLKNLSLVIYLGTGFLASLCVIVFLMVHTFEKITYDAVSDSNRDFAISINALTETLNSSIVNYERQLFYSNTVKTLFKKDGFSDTEKSYIMRDLNSILNAADFTEAIYVYNGYTETVYSTGPFFARKLEDVNAVPIRQLLQNRNVNQRSKPVYCREDGDEEHEEHNYYAFMFCELYPDGTSKPNALIVTINSDWYRNFLLLANPSSDLIVIDSGGNILLSANDSLNESYADYYRQIDGDTEYGYILGKKGKEICMFYQSPSTGHTYLRITPVQELVPRLFHFRKIVIWFIVGLSCLFAVLLLILFVFSFFPMLRMKDAIKRVDLLLTGENKASDDRQSDVFMPQPVLQKQIKDVVSKSERLSKEQVFYDMLSKKCPSDVSK